MPVTIDSFKAYDVRGQIPNQLNADICYRIGNATAEFIDARSVVVGRDMRLSSGEFAEAVTDLQPFVELFEERTGSNPTYFEITAALAFSYFAANAVDVAVIEVGLGGRLDDWNGCLDLSCPPCGPRSGNSSHDAWKPRPW